MQAGGWDSKRLVKSLTLEEWIMHWRNGIMLKPPRKVIAAFIAAMTAGLLLASVPAVLLLALVWRAPDPLPSPPTDQTNYVDKTGDEELAYLLVRLVKRTRQVIGSHYTRSQSPVPGVDAIYKRLLTRNAVLPAAVAGVVFSKVVPSATGGRAWVKMVVPEPRNPDNRGDATALELVSLLRDGAQFVERSTPGAVYYGEPIKAKAGCLICHGEPKGDPDPFFSKYKKNGWRVDDIIGGVIARVAPESRP